jgi:phage-related protein
MAQLWSSFTPLQQALAISTAASGLAFAGFGSALKYAIEQGQTIQDTLTNVSIAVQGASQYSQQLQDTIISLADNSVFSVSQVGDAFVQLGEHGDTAAQILQNDVGTAAIDLAEALNTQVVPATDLLSVSMQLFGANASEATKYSNILTAAFYNGIPSVSGLQSAITAAGPPAKTLGISFQDLSIMLDILGKNLGSGQLAGTALQNMLKDLVSPSNNATKALQQLGIISVNDTPQLYAFIDSLASSGKAGAKAADSFDGTASSLLKLFQAAQAAGTVPMDQTFLSWAEKNGFLNNKLFDSTGKFLGLKNAVDQLNIGLQGLPPEQQAAILTSIFNIKGSKGIESLTGDVNSFNTAWGNLETIFSNTSSQQDAAKQTGTLTGALKEFKTTLADAFGLTGMQIIPQITAFVQHLNGLVDKFNHLSPAVKQAVGHFLLIGTAISGGTFAFSGLGLILSFVSKNFGAFGNILGSIFGPATGLLGMFKNLAGFGGILKGAYLGIPGMFGSLGGTISSVFGTLTFAFKNFGMILPVLRMGLGSLFSGGLSALPGMLSGAIPAAVGLGGSIAAIAAPVLAVIGIIAIIILLFTKFRTQGMEIVDMFKTAFTPIFNAVAATFKQVMGQIMTAWNQAMPQIKPAMNNLVAGFHAAMPVIQFFGKVLGAIIQGALKLIGGLVVGIIKAIGPIINVFAGILKVIGDIGKIVVAVFHGDFTGAFKALEDMIVHIMSVFKNFYTAIWDIVSGLVTGVINFFKQLFDTLVGHSIIPDMVNGIMAVFNFLKTAAMAVFNALVNPAIALFHLFAAGISAEINLVVSVFHGFMSFLGGLVGWISGTVVNPIKGFFQSLGDGISSAINRASGVFGSFRNSVVGALRGVLGPVEGFLSGLSKLPLVGGIFGGVLSVLHSIHLAEGGIVTGPTRALIGEGGEAEAVIPLSKLSQMLQGIGGGFNNQKTGDIHNHIYFGNKEVADVVVDGMTGRLRSNGFARRFR